MFNMNKQDDLKNKAADLADNVKDNVEQVTKDVKRSAESISNSVQHKAAETKHEALNVIDSLKSLLAQYTNSTNVNELKNQILDKAYELKGTVKDEVTHAYETSKERTVQTVQDKPLLSLGLAVGAGLLLGYILGSKQSSK
ncbi:MAG: hypothetical protein CTY37_03555 [Methylotenera sp.]|nr:hypothetical protein [Methylotenera sp.]PPC87468.1 MAG: hypothetical protein CTY37_03555 [Methylotenera sp.]PPD18921.1 MAG: hypothetical protein CTY27_00450 [Methylotenera sp.]PPD56632.1 MAG: hypothetical protein CTY10_03275 [Methylotenera sp.]